MKLITDTLREIRRGVVVEHASRELAEVTKAVMATGKPGSLTLKIIVKPPKSRGDNAVAVAVLVNAQEPQAELPEAMFYADVSGDLLRDDPTQQRLFADASAPQGERVDRETGEVLSA